MPTLKSINAKAGTNFRRTTELIDALKSKEEPLQDWHPQIHREYAEQDGFTPADFTWLDYPVSNVRLTLNPSRHVDLDYLAELPPNTPQLNVYIEEKDRQEGVEYLPAEAGWLKIPDPVGTALAWVRFTLIDVADGAELHESSSPSHFVGAIQGGLSATARGVPLWERLTPGTSIRVRVEARPEFFPWVDENGGGHLGYTTESNGYFKGDKAISPEYTLALTPPPESVLLLDGQPVAPPPELRGAADGEAFHEWLSRERQAITAKDSWVTAEIIAGQLPGTDLERYQGIEAGTITPEDWERHNIEDVIKGWQQTYG